MTNLPHAYICTLFQDSTRVSNVNQNIVNKLGEQACTVWPAIDGRTEELEEFFKLKGSELDMDLAFFDLPGYGCPRTAVAIVCSFIQILEDAIAKKREGILIFEDDACLSDDFASKLEALLEELPEDADFLKLYCKFGLNYHHLVPNKTLIHFYPLTNSQETWGADSFYITEKGMPVLLKLLKSAKDVFDGIFYRHNHEGVLRGYMSKDNTLCTHGHYDFKSTNARDNSINRCNESVMPLMQYQRSSVCERT